MTTSSDMIGRPISGSQTSQSPGQPSPVAIDAHDTPLTASAGNAESREFFEQLGFIDAPGQVISGSDLSDILTGAPEAESGGLPGALSFYSFANHSGGAFADLRGGPSATAYVDTGSTAEVSATLRSGPDGTPESALAFNGKDTFAYLPHSPALEVGNGTIALWVQPDDLSDDGIILSKDLRGSGDGGHFRLGHEEDGTLFIRFATGDGGGNRAWESSVQYLVEGEWSHIAVSFSSDGGIEVYVDGAAVPDRAWIRTEGNEDLPSLASEAYLWANREPWILGADTSRAQETASPEIFAGSQNKLRDPFDGAIADLGIWGGASPEDALSSDEIYELATNGPGSALTGAAGAQPMVAADDVINAGGGNDQLFGEAGDDTLRGEAGHDTLTGGYGNDLLEGGDGRDVLEGGRGADLLLGGDGDDVLISGSDAGEQRIGQLAIGEPTRDDPDGEVNPDRQKLYGWEDQPLVADDILVGGAGRDTFLFNPQINGKRDIILEHVNTDRTINWAGVAGENDELHDHWVDSFGIDVIADYNAADDTIAIVGHTVAPEVESRLIDTDGDGVVDDAISIITVYSQQHGGGGAHTQDLIGQIVVYGDPVAEEDLIIDAGVTHGIVETIDELQEALAPTGALKQTLIDGQTVYGYDTRDADGNLGAIVMSPQDFVDNPWVSSSLFSYASALPEGEASAAVVLSADNSVLDPEMRFDGDDADFVSIDHDAAFELVSGTVSLSFSLDEIDGIQTLIGKDASGFQNGGHLSIEVSKRGKIEVRMQGEIKGEFKNINLRSGEIEAGEEYQLTFTFSPEGTALYLNGELVDTDDGFAAGMTANTESWVIGGGTTTRKGGTLDNLKEFMTGSVSDVLVFDRALSAGEVVFLANDALEVVTGPTESASSDSPAVTVSSKLSASVTFTDEAPGADSDPGAMAAGLIQLVGVSMGVEEMLLG